MTTYTRDRYAHRSAEDIAEHDRFMAETVEEAAVIEEADLADLEAFLARWNGLKVTSTRGGTGGLAGKTYTEVLGAGGPDPVPNAEREALDALFKRPGLSPDTLNLTTPSRGILGATRAFLIGFALVAAYIAATIWAWGIPE